MSVHFPFDNTYARLPAGFFARVKPTPVAGPGLVKINRELACDLGLDPDALASRDGLEILSGQRVPEGAEPLAAAYSGHQFGHFSPQLGDGRAILLGEVVDRSGARRDIQLKGSGLTPFSRGGDGRAALGPVLREYLVSEAMFALGVPTTRALAAVTTGEPVLREEILPGAVLTRVASSHIRVGTFQYFASRRNLEALRQLADHVIERHYPDARNAPQPYRALLDGVIGRQGELIARWLLLGFIHGVMNTDNMSVSGETIDYGPCAFMDAYDPATVFSSIDRNGRYAYANQPGIAQWNLARLAECLVPLLAEDQEEALAQAQEALDRFVDVFNATYLSGLRRKLGFATDQGGDLSLAQDLLNLMAEARADFTLTFRHLSEAANNPGAEAGLRELFDPATGLDGWLARWRARLSEDGRDGADAAASMRRANPAVIPRNHLIEAMIEAAVERQDYRPFEEMLAAVSRPYEARPEFARYAAAPPRSDVPYRTFCGT
jgi:serine/tyrosine/threonine adenylyltransferase